MIAILFVYPIIVMAMGLILFFRYRICSQKEVPREALAMHN
jgi:hypothetical protein